MLSEVLPCEEEVRDPRARRILARTVFRALRCHGAGPERVIDFVNDLLEMLHEEQVARRRTHPKPVVVRS